MNYSFISNTPKIKIGFCRQARKTPPDTLKMETEFLPQRYDL
jgi:hypothetical protein